MKRRAMEFHPPGRAAPDHVLAEVEIPFTEGPLAGMTLTGIKIRVDKENLDEFYVTFPGRAYERDGGRRYWSFIRGEPEHVLAARERIVAVFRDFARLPAPVSR